MNNFGQMQPVCEGQQMKRRDLTDAEIETVARAAHEANRGFCFAHSDLSQPTWDDAPDWQKESAIEGVKFHVANPFTDERNSHDKWMERKLREGWRWGEIKDADAKVHPCLLPYHALSAADKVKDSLFRAIVVGYVAALRAEQ